VTDGVIKSAGRALEVLETFTRERRPLTAKQLERALCYPPSSTIMLLKSLTQLGYLRFDRRRHTYHPTLRVALLGQWLREGMGGSDAVFDAMHALAERTCETVFLSTPNDVDMQVTHIVPGPQPISLQVDPGRRVPMSTSAVGHAFLATRSDDEVRALVRRMNRDRSLRGQPPPIEVESTLLAVERTRRDGYAVAYDILPGVGAVACSVPRQQDGRDAVICVGGPSERIRAAATLLGSELRRCLDDYFTARSVA
jgi:IclR family transcriptional regulator, KDG regulon repressor